jgi:hypothetical protein
MTTFNVSVSGIVGDSASLSQAVIGIEYIDPTNHYEDQIWYVFDATTPQTEEWTFQAPAGGDGAFFYQGTLLSIQGIPTSIPRTFAASNTLVLGPESPAISTILISPVLLDWTRMTSADITLTGGGGLQTFTFNRATEAPQYASFGGGPISWSAVYTLTDGVTQYTFGDESDAGAIVVLLALPPVTSLQVSVNAADFTALGIESVLFSLDNPPGGAAQSFTFTAANVGAPWAPEIFETATDDGAWSVSYAYTYTVTAPMGIYTSPTITGTQSVITIDELGFRTFALTGDAALLQSVQVSHGSPAQSFSLSVGAPTQTLKAGVDFPAGAPLPYSAQLMPEAIGTTTMSGCYALSGTTTAAVSFTSPFLQKTVQLTSGSGTLWLSISGSTESGFTDAHGAWSLTSPAFAPPRGPASCSFVVVNPAAAALKYSGTFIPTGSQGQVQIQATATTATQVTIDGTTQWFSVSFDPSLVDWSLYSSVSLSVSQDPGGSAQVLTFGPTDGTQYWGFSYPTNGTTGTYSYTATYTPTSGPSKCYSAAAGTSGSVTLLPTPPATGTTRSRA